MSPITERPANFVNQCRAVLATCTGVFLLAAGDARAEVIHVPGDVATIQGAIELATDGDEIVVAPGEYHELIDLLGQAIHLRSAEGPDETLISGRELNGSVVRCVSGEGPETIIEGFTITEGTAADPETGAYGGGMLIEGSSPTVRNCRFVNNFAAYGGGLAVVGGSNVTLQHCLFVANGAVSLYSDGVGGGVLIDSSSASLHNTRLLGNRSQAGGAIGCRGSATVTLIECKLDGNLAHVPWGTFDPDNAGFGGALLGTDDSSVTIKRCRMARNAAKGGGALATGENPGSWPTITAVDSWFIDNISQSFGNVILHASGDMLVDRCRVRGNRRMVPIGGAPVILTWSALTIRNTVFVSNQGSIVRSTSAGFAEIVNSIIYDTKALLAPLLGVDGGAQLSVRNSVLWNNGINPIYEGDISHSVVQFGFDSDGIIDTNPLFTNEAQFNLRPQADSPAIDAGVNDFVDDDELDLDHRPRIMDGDLDGKPVVDLGPYEYLPGGCDPPFDFEISKVRIEPDEKPSIVTKHFTIQLRAFADLGDGTTVEITDHPCAHWHANDPTVATVSSAGEVRGASVGETRIGITIDDQRTSVPVLVELNGEAAYALDDGIADAFGGSAAQSFAALNEFHVQPGAELITEILVDWGDLAFGPGTVSLCLWSDPNQDGVPDDAEVLWQFNVTPLPSHGRFERYPIPPTSVGPPGTNFYAGLIRTLPPAMPIHKYPLLPVDSTTPQRRSWFVGSLDPVNPDDLSIAVTLPWGNWMIRANGMPGQAGDLNHDGAVDAFDLLVLVASWGDCPAGGAPCPADLNGDDLVNVSDLLILLNAFGIPGNQN